MDNYKIIMLIVIVLIAGFLLGSITGEAVKRRKAPSEGGGGKCTDRDKDGYFAQSNCGTPHDCNDRDASINPSTTEICGNSIDENCDGIASTCSIAYGEAGYSGGDYEGSS